jgi:nicotinate dehydrogenase subunit A
MPREIALEVNGKVERVRVDPGTPLLQVLRNDLGLTAAKLGCGLEQCYACAVILDDQEVVPTCAAGVDAFVGRRITTLEGIGAAGHLHPVQQAFLDEEAAQCGYCIPGMIVGAVALLRRNPDPSDQEIREALEPHLCRCGVHWRVLRAVRRAARSLR